jgi:glycosyltransferase involved in cell wall biosynthesis
VAVVIPTIHGRESLLAAALASVGSQDYQGAVATVVQVDVEHEGAARTRNRALEGLRAPWTAFLDDDDWFYPRHLSTLVAAAEETGADVVYPWFDLSVNGALRNHLDPLKIGHRQAFRQPFDPRALVINNYIPVTVLARTERLLDVAGFPFPGSPDWPHADCEDWGLWLRLLHDGARFHHVPERTWVWNWHGKNTSGRPDTAARIYER